MHNKVEMKLKPQLTHQESSTHPLRFLLNLQLLYDTPTPTYYYFTMRHQSLSAEASTSSPLPTSLDDTN